MPPDPTNAVADEPRAAELGEAFFFETRFSANGAISCATCHQPIRRFTDGLPKGVAIGVSKRHTTSIVGTAYSPWLYWDGRRDSLWAQALTPLEAPVEMGTTRVAAVRYVLGHPQLADAYRDTFGTPRSDPDALPATAGPFGDADAKAAWAALGVARQQAVNQDFANIGKAIAAYEAKLKPAPSRFDRYVAARTTGDARAETLLNAEERAGLALFLDPGKGQCLRCHNGPLFTNHGFHNVGTGVFEGERLDFGRLLGVRAAHFDEFNCLGDYSDAAPEDCRELRYLNPEADPRMQGAFKVPGLRSVAATAPYGHDGRFANLAEVIDHYRDPPEQAARLSELNPLPLTDRERDQLVAFLGTLTSAIDVEARWLQAPPVQTEPPQ